MADNEFFTVRLTARELARLEVADPTDPALAADLAGADEALNNWRALLARLETARCR